MPESLTEIIATLERLAAYDGPWQALREESPLLNERVAELRAREQRLDDLLTVALVGGSGVGKSTLLNALAGDEIAETSPLRPCTTAPIVYHPPGAQLPFSGWRSVSRSALEQLILIDTPDSDSIVHQHREQTIAVLSQCDLILLCASAEKYLDEATWSLLRPLRGQRTFVCIETKSRGGSGVREHWLERLRQEGFDVSDAHYFQVNALRSFDRKLAGRPPDEGELDFPRFERFLREELTRERIARIKRSNVAGLLRLTVERLGHLADTLEPYLDELDQQVRDAGARVAQETLALVERQFFAETHLWSYALGREVSLRAKGFAGGAYKLFEFLRSLPVRLPSLLPWAPRSEGPALTLLAGPVEGTEPVTYASGRAVEILQSAQSHLALAFSRHGLDYHGANDLQAFESQLGNRLTGVIRGPARERIARAAARLTCWPLTVLADLPLLAFFVYTVYRLVGVYFTTLLPTTSFFLYIAAVFSLLIIAECALMSLFVRLAAWRIRRRSRSDLRVALFAAGLVFPQAAASLARLRALLGSIRSLAAALGAHARP